MKEIFKKLTRFIHSEKHSTTYREKIGLPEICFNKSFVPSVYLTDGWLVEQGQDIINNGAQASDWDPYLVREIKSKDIIREHASWSYGKYAKMLLPLLRRESGFYFLKIKVGAFLAAENNNVQKVQIAVNGGEVDTWLFNHEGQFEKLIVIPMDLVPENGLTEIVFSTPNSINNIDENQDTLPRGKTLGIELFSMIVFDCLEAYLEDLQRKYEEACAYRGELLEREGQDLVDRGELVDVAKNTLRIFDEVHYDKPVIREKLNDFVNNRFLVGCRDAEKIFFDEKYFTRKEKELKEGLIHYEIDKWVSELKNFKNAVIDAGNYAFRKFNIEKDEQSIELNKLLEKQTFSQEKLAELKNKNDTLNNLEILLQKDEITSFPPNLEIEMTSYCNFRCIMCSRSMMKFYYTRQNDLQILEISKILPFVKNVTIAGVGEPCVSNKLDILSRVTKAFGCYTILFTNGSMLHEQLEAVSRFSRVNVSFDGPSEEILGTQRRNSNFKEITGNIKALREKAPDIYISLNVVVTRINLDEVDGIVKVGGELGVNDISLSPVFNIPLLELKFSDMALFSEHVARAKELATKYNVVLHNNVHEASFSTENDKPRDKKALMVYFKNLPAQEEISYNIDSIAEKFIENEFNYYPNPKIFFNDQWPSPTHGNPAPDEDTKSPTIGFAFNVDGEIAKIEGKINQLRKEVQEKPESWFTMSYCFSLWKYGYAKSNGKCRLCPFRNVAVGNYREAGLKKTINSHIVRNYRKSMFSPEKIVPMCKGCEDHHKQWALESFKQTCEEVGLDIARFGKCG